MRYPRRHDEPRALARELAALRRGIDAARRPQGLGDIPDNVPAPDEVTPSALQLVEIEGAGR